ncbi:MAG: tetratricopeptide repeat protein [Armatimonadota bacterium]|nr:tetratricopeptide repeat protein [Armatimonadota bacterium]
MLIIKHLRSHKNLYIYLVLALITLIVYGRSLGHNFTNYDDRPYVTCNSIVKSGLTIKGMIWAFTTGHSSNWHPLTWMSHMLDCRLYGLRPWGHHLTSLLLHILNTALLFYILYRITGCKRRGAFIAALFAIHPLHVESVAWVAERKDVLSALFWMLTTLAYVSYVERPRLKKYLLVAGIFSLGLMSKPMLVSLPLVFLLLDYWPLGRLKSTDHEPLRLIRRLVVEKVPLFILAAASCVATYIVQQASGATNSLAQTSIGVRIANAFVSYISYLWKMIWPANLAVMYPHPKDTLPEWQVAGAVILLLFLCACALRLRRRCPYLTVGWFWYVITLIPVIGLVQVGEQAMADRYTYIPLVGIFIIVSWGIPDLLHRLSQSLRVRILAVAAGAVIPALMVCAWLQVGYWRNSITLFERSLACTSNNYVAHYNIAAALEAHGKLDEATRHYSEATLIRPEFFQAQMSLGYALIQKKEFDEAVDHYLVAVELKPRNPRSHYNLGLALQYNGSIYKAIDEYRVAVKLEPDFIKARGSLGNALLEMGKTDEAIEQYREVLRLHPGEKTALHNLSAAQALKLNPGRVAVGITAQAPVKRKADEEQNALGVALFNERKIDQAISRYREALRLNPRLTSARCNLGVALASQGNLDEAVIHYRKALKIDQNHVEAHCNLAAALATKGNLDEAIKHFSEAARLKPDLVDAHSNLAIALFYKGDYARAWKEVYLCRKYGGNPNPRFVEDLSRKMPDPGL